MITRWNYRAVGALRLFIFILAVVMGLAVRPARARQEPPANSSSQGGSPSAPSQTGSSGSSSNESSSSSSQDNSPSQNDSSSSSSSGDSSSPSAPASSSPGESSSSANDASAKKDKSAKPPEYNPLPAEKDVEVGEFYLHKGDLDAAVSRFEDAIAQKANYAKPRLLLAQIYEKKGDSSAAAKYYKEYLQVYPSAPDRNKIEKKIAKLGG